MRLLLDTHVFLWLQTDPERLRASTRTLLAATENEVYLSVASVWEMAIKLSLGKLTLAISLDTLIEEGAVNNGFSLVDVRREHAVAVTHLPFHHRDPFDRLLVTQAMTDKMTIVSNDAELDAYPIQRLW